MNTKRKKIALVIYNSGELFLKHPGATNGGGAVVSQNLYKTLTNQLDCHVDIYTFIKPAKNNNLKNTTIIHVNEILNDYNNEKFTEYLNTQSYNKIITINPSGIFRNKLIQVHSLAYRLKRENLLIKIIKTLFLYKKIKHIEQNYDNLTGKDSFIAVSYKIKDDYSQNYGIPRSQIQVTYPGCEQIYQQLPEIIQKQFPTLGIVANSAINKGCHLFLAAAGIAKLLTKQKFKILIIAPKFNFDILMQTIVFIFKLKKDVIVLPKQNDMREFYSNIEYLILPSKKEAFGLVALEAMSYGKPTLVSDTAGCAEIINFQNGFIFRRDSLFDFVKNIIAMLNLYSNDFERYKNLAYQAHKTSLKFTWTNFCKKILE